MRNPLIIFGIAAISLAILASLSSTFSVSMNENDPLNVFAKDGYIQVELQKFF